jgi:hypothetical protein
MVQGYAHKPDSVVGIQTGLGLDGPGIELRWGQDCRQLFISSMGSPSHLYSVYQVIPASKAVGSGVNVHNSYMEIHVPGPKKNSIPFQLNSKFCS